MHITWHRHCSLEACCIDSNRSTRCQNFQSVIDLGCTHTPAGLVGIPAAAATPLHRHHHQLCSLQRVVSVCDCQYSAARKRKGTGSRASVGLVRRGCQSGTLGRHKSGAAGAAAGGASAPRCGARADAQHTRTAGALPRYRYTAVCSHRRGDGGGHHWLGAACEEGEETALLRLGHVVQEQVICRAEERRAGEGRGEEQTL